MGATSIEWADLTFNPWHGCEKVSPACAHCYAEGQSNRFNGAGMWGAGHGFRFQTDAYWARPLAWAHTWPKKLGRRPRVFCASMADVFEDRRELEDPRVRLMMLIERTPELDWLLLTKRPEFARDWLARWYAAIERGNFPAGTRAERPYSNVWMGVSIENSRYTWRADVLREIPAAVRFISAEPLLGSLFPIGSMSGDRWANTRSSHAPLDLTGIDWVIAGGESGPKARPSHPDWFRELRAACLAQCASCDVNYDFDRTLSRCPDRPAFFFKQWGEWADGSTLDRSERDRVITHDGKVRTWPQWSEDGYRAGAGHARPVVMHRAGKRATGRELDGHSWDEFPQSATVPA